MSKMNDLSIRIQEFLLDADNVSEHTDPYTGLVCCSRLAEDCLDTLGLFDDDGECDADVEDYVYSLAAALHGETPPDGWFDRAARMDRLLSR